MIRKTLIACALAATLGSGALAQEAAPQTMQHGQGMMGHGVMHGHGMMHGRGMDMGGGDEGVASLAFRGANMKMHRGMAIEYTGDADVDFVKGMIPHHEGAIDMAKIVLVFGKDPEVRKLAEEVIKAQESEVAWMKDWLAKNAK